MNIIDEILNATTMYRVVLYYLLTLLVLAFAVSFTGLLPFQPIDLVISSSVFILLAWSVNIGLSYFFKAPANIESSLITGSILSLIFTPRPLTEYQVFLPAVFAIAIFAMASKYLLSIEYKHIFNPVIIGAIVSSFVLKVSASWWIGSTVMLPAVIFGGLLIVRKIRRADIAFSFIIAALLGTILYGAEPGFRMEIIKETLINSPLFFFAFVMITEPLTTPPTRDLRIIYGALTGFLFVPLAHFGPLYSTPELALLLGNLFSYLVSPKDKLVLTLDRKEQVTPTVYDFIFTHSHQDFTFAPGQYVEWTLGHHSPDNRGNRRYFTLASSPTENEIHLGVKFYEPASTFKRALSAMKPGDTIVASQLAGDFILPKDKHKKLAFIAGGVGITPFRSMIKYLTDTNDTRDAVLYYSVRTLDEAGFKPLFDEATQKIGLKAVYAVTVTDDKTPSWCAPGFVDEKLIASQTPDYKERTFYISGPHVMVDATLKTLTKMGVPRTQIHTDFFPGFA